MNIEEIYNYLKSNELFWGVSEESFKLLFQSSNISIVDFFTDEIIAAQNSKLSAVGFVLQGKCSMVNPLISFQTKALHVGDSFNLTSCSGERNLTFSITSASQCKVLFLNSSTLFERIKHDAILMSNYINALLKEIDFLHTFIASYSNQRPIARVASFLKGNFGEYKTFRLSSSFSDIAQSLNISRASFYRALNIISSSGAIVREGKSFRLIYPQKLEEYIGGSYEIH